MPQETLTLVGRPESESRRGDHFRDALLVAGAILMAATLYLTFLYVPTDANLGVSQRIFYFHVPVAILSLLSVVVVAVASAFHLFRKGERSDAVAYASAEVGFVFCTIAIVTGSDLGQARVGRVVDVGPEADPHARALVHLCRILDAPSVRAERLAGRALRGRPRPHRLPSTLPSSTTPLSCGARPILIWYSARRRRATPSTRGMLVAVLVSLITFVVLFVYLIVERYSLRKAETDVDEIFQYAA